MVKARFFLLFSVKDTGTCWKIKTTDLSLGILSTKPSTFHSRTFWKMSLLLLVPWTHRPLTVQLFKPSDSQSTTSLQFIQLTSMDGGERKETVTSIYAYFLLWHLNNRLCFTPCNRRLLKSFIFLVRGISQERDGCGNMGTFQEHFIVSIQKHQDISSMFFLRNFYLILYIFLSLTYLQARLWR